MKDPFKNYSNICDIKYGIAVDVFCSVNAPDDIPDPKIILFNGYFISDLLDSDIKCELRDLWCIPYDKFNHLGTSKFRSLYTKIDLEIHLEFQTNDEHLFSVDDILLNQVSINDLVTTKQRLEIHKIVTENKSKL